MREAVDLRSYVLAGAQVVAGEDLELVESGFVRVEDGVIVEVGEGAPSPGPAVVDVRGHLVMPGMINCHTHLGDAAVKELNAGVPSDVNLLWQPDGLRHVRMAELDRATRVAAMRSAVRHALATGTVALADFREGGVEGVHELRDATEGLPVRCIAFARHTRFPLHTDEELMANTVGLSQEQMAEVRAGLRVAEGFSPLWANDTTDRGLAQLSRLVREQGKLLATHAGETPRYRQISMSRTGRSDVARVVDHLKPDFVVHMTAATPEELDLAADADLPLVMCARTQAGLGYGLPPFLDAVRRGLRVGLGTDNAMISSPDLLAELEFLSRALRSATGDPAPVDARRLLAAVTIDAARILKLDAQLGSLDVGKAASMVVLDLRSDNLVGTVNPIASIVDRAGAADVRAVLINGKVVHGKLSRPI